MNVLANAAEGLAAAVRLSASIPGNLGEDLRRVLAMAQQLEQLRAELEQHASMAPREPFVTAHQIRRAQRWMLKRGELLARAPALVAELNRGREALQRQTAAMPGDQVEPWIVGVLGWLAVGAEPSAGSDGLTG